MSSYLISKEMGKMRSIKIILFAIAVSLVTSIALASPQPQIEWAKPFGGAKSDSFMSVQQTNDGYIMTGYKAQSDTSNSTDVWLFKTNSNGDQSFSYNLGELNKDDHGYSIAPTSDDGYIITGDKTRSSGPSGTDVWLIKINSTGQTQWDHTFGGSGSNRGWSVQQMSDGGYIVAGYTSSFGNGGYDAWLIKTDSSGAPVWTNPANPNIVGKTFGGTGNDYASSVCQVPGGYLIAGYTNSFGNKGGYSDAWLIKTDMNGNESWNRTFGGTGDDSASSVCQVSDGYIIAGKTNSFGNGGSDAWLIKTDLDGNELWNRTFGGIYSDSASSVCQVFDDHGSPDGYLIAGTYSSDNRYTDAWLIKTDLAGNKIWDLTYGGKLVNDRGYSAIGTADGKYILVGYITNSGTDGFIIKVGEKEDAKPPIAKAGGPYFGNEGSPISFDASKSDGKPLQYRWDFDNNGTWDTVWSASPIAEHTWSDDWKGSAKLGVSNGNLTDIVTDTASVTVNNVPPTATIVTENNSITTEETASNLTITAGDYITFKGIFTDPGIYDTHTATWNFGDSSPEVTILAPDGNGIFTVGHSYFKSGEYTINLNVSDNNGGNGTDSLILEVIPISATIDIDPNTINKKSGGQWVTVYIELPAEYDVKNIDPKTVMINDNDKVLPIMDPKYGFVSSENDYITDVDNDGIPERMFKFNRSDVASILDTGDSVEVTVIGGVKYKNESDSDLADFVGTDTIKVMDKGKSIATRVDGNISFAALSPYPQPCNPEVWIPYTLGQDVDVKIRIYNDRGQLIRTLNLGHQAAGLYLNRDKSAYWDGKNESGEEVSSGIYFYIIRAGDFVTTKKFVIIR
jgi:predicted secreted protein